MGKRDNTTILWVAGAVAVGWFLAPKALKEQITGGVPGIGIDLSGLLGGGVGQAPLDWGGLIPEFSFPAWEFPPFPETPLLDYTGIIQDILDAGNTAAKVVGQAATDALSVLPSGEPGSDADTTPPPAPKGTWEWMMEEFTGLHPVVKNVLAGTVGLGGVYGGVKTVQALAPAGRTVATAMGNVVASALKGKPPAGRAPIPKVTGFKMPAGVKPSLWKQWLRYSSLGKGLAKAGTPMFAIGGIAQWFQEMLFPGGGMTVEEMMTPGMLWTGSGRYEPADVTLPRSIPMTESMGNVVNITEGGYSVKEQPPKAESKYTPIIYKNGLPDI